MITLTIDIGNTRTKADSWCDDGIILREASGNDITVDRILEIFEKLPDIEGIAVSTVRNDSQGFIRELRERTGVLVVDFNNEEIHKCYDLSHYKGNIGPDRYAAVLGANVLFPNMAKLVIDMGTAMTIDVVDKENVFCGGTISLGYYKRMKALATSTSRLPEVDDRDYNKTFGEDTATAIIAGARNGVKGEILYALESAKREYEIKCVIFTGGDAYNVFSKDNISSLCDDYLVGRGLDYHIRTHYLHARVGNLQI